VTVIGIATCAPLRVSDLCQPCRCYRLIQCVIQCVIHFWPGFSRRYSKPLLFLTYAFKELNNVEYLIVRFPSQVLAW